MTAGSEKRRGSRPRTLEGLIRRAVEDAATLETSETDDVAGRGDRFIILTPARLRPVVERRTLEYLRDHTTGRPGVTVAVHSFSSLVRSEIGNHAPAAVTDSMAEEGDDAAVRPPVSMFVLRAALADRMRHDKDTFREAGNTFGSVDQFAAQVAELANAGVAAADVRRAATGSGSAHLMAVARLLGYAEEDFGRDPVLAGGGAANAADWIGMMGRRLHVYLYGFEQPAPAEARMIALMTRVADVVTTGERGHRSDVMCAAIDDKVSRSEYAGLPELAVPDDGEDADAPAGGQDSVDVWDARSGARFAAYTAVDGTEELRCAASLVRRLLDGDGRGRRGGRVPASEILVTARDLGPYRAMLDTVFGAAGIPVNTAPAATMADQPLGKLLLDLLGDRLPDPSSGMLPDPAVVMRVWRTGLIRAARYRVDADALDALDVRLCTEDPRRVWADDADPGTGAAVTRIRMMLAAARRAFHPTVGESASDGVTVREALARMVVLLQDLGVTRPAADAGDAAGVDAAADARLFESTREVWRVVMAQFDDMVTRFGGRRFADFEPTFADNLANLLASQPAGGETRAANAVDVTAFPAPMRPYRHVIMLGCTEAVLPAVPHESGLLDDVERLRLADSLKRSKPVAAECLRALSVHGRARREVLAFNRVLANAERVTFLCPRSSDGVAQSLSPFVARVLPQVPDEGYNRRHPGATRTRNRTIDDLPSFPLDPNVVEDGCAGADGAVYVTVAPDSRTVDPATAMRLFTRPDGEGRALNVSVSTIENYYRNPFEFFMGKGLRVDAIEPFELTPAIRGSFYHDVLQRAVGVRIALNALLAAGDPSDDATQAGTLHGVPGDYLNPDGTGKDIHALIDLLSDLDYEPRPFDGLDIPLCSLLEENPQFAILASGNRMRAVRAQLVRDLHLFADRLEATFRDWGANLLHEGERTEFTLKPQSTERQFGIIGGKPGKWPSLTDRIDVDGQPVTLRIRGKVDRIETVRREGDGDGSFVIDYKSTAKRHTLFPDGDATKVYHGRELQLLTYADAVRKLDRSEEPSNTRRNIVGVTFMPICVNDSEYLIAEAMRAVPADPSGETGTRDGNADESWRRLFPLVRSSETAIEGNLPAQPLDVQKMGCLWGLWTARDKQESDKRMSVKSLPKAWGGMDPGPLLDFAHHMILAACRSILEGDLPVAPYLKVTSDGDTEDGTKYSDFMDVMALDLLDGNVWRYEAPKTLDELKEAAGQPTAGASTQAVDGEHAGMAEKEDGR